ncbi:MAG: hypothetical protein WA393_12090, partial [Nitrososphaeraceae archaeon]
LQANSISFTDRSLLPNIIAIKLETSSGIQIGEMNYSLGEALKNISMCHTPYWRKTSIIPN